MRACKDWFEGVGELADAEQQQQQQEEAVAGHADGGGYGPEWDVEDLLDVQQDTFLTLREISRRTGLLSSMTAWHWSEFCARHTPPPRMHAEACVSNRDRARWPADVDG